MKKPQALREYLLKSLPDLPTDQDRLRIVADQGSMQSLITAGYSFEMSYKLEILLTECVIEPEVIALVIFTWLKEQQSELMANHAKSKEAITFESEIIDNEKSDIYFSINLTERVIVSKTETGQLEISYPDEPKYTDYGEPTNVQVIANGDILFEFTTIEKQGCSLDMPFTGRNP
ncbi:phage tail protein [Acinetobacter bereziniae]|uniref:phage tail protein n=1 Tax=Acinetobacter bereziniae TaxID=106648 RepID=UPI002578D017|nr:phage tail protein [Acinetobacter bereziniae]MDM1784267.1 phage tail protein [Acinetobacter bereziniae]